MAVQVIAGVDVDAVHPDIVQDQDQEIVTRRGAGTPTQAQARDEHPQQKQPSHPNIQRLRPIRV